MIIPRIHLNGSAAQTLIEQQTAVVNASTKLLEALREASPNGRDFYPLEPGAFERACEEHAARVREGHGRRMGRDSAPGRDRGAGSGAEAMKALRMLSAPTTEAMMMAMRIDAIVSMVRRNADEGPKRWRVEGYGDTTNVGPDDSPMLVGYGRTIRSAAEDYRAATGKGLGVRLILGEIAIPFRWDATLEPEELLPIISLSKRRQLIGVTDRHLELDAAARGDRRARRSVRKYHAVRQGPGFLYSHAGVSFHMGSI